MSREPADPVDAPASGPERPSKTQLKRAMHELQALGAELAALPPDRLAHVGLPEPLHAAIVEWQRTRTHEARRRQLQYIGRLMRSVDAQPLREALARERIGGARETLALHRAERWRDELIADDAALTRFVAAHPAVDRAALQRLVRSARAAASGPTADGRRGRDYRELFRLLIKEVSTP